jgi:hypothetical protein
MSEGDFGWLAHFADPDAWIADMEERSGRVFPESSRPHIEKISARVRALMSGELEFKQVDRLDL